MTPRRISLLCAVGCLASGCMVGPDYKRPELAIPPIYRGAEAQPPAAPAETFGDLKWWNVFPDPDLQALIRTALAQNYDLRIAVARILQAQSQVTIARSQQFPTVDGSVSAPYAAYTGSDRPATLVDHAFQPQAGVDVAWELDFWGKFRRNTESAQANLLASDEARYVVMATLVTQIADAYLTLRALDLTLEISQRTVKSRVRSVELVQARLDGGVAGVLDLRQAETLLYGATKAIPDIQRQIEQQENFISILLGQNPGPIKRGRPLDQQIAAPALPPGLPLDLLLRRPDIQQAEQQLVSANAQIGVATALLYPQVTLSGFAGVGGATISGSNFGPFGIFSALPAITLPIFNMGRLQANVGYNEAAGSASGTELSADPPAGVARSVGRPGRHPQTAGIPAAAGTARQGSRGRQRGREHAIRRWGVQLPRSPGYGASAVPGATRFGPGEARRVVERDPALQGTRRRVADRAARRGCRPLKLHEVGAISRCRLNDRGH